MSVGGGTRTGELDIACDLHGRLPQLEQYFFLKPKRLESIFKTRLSKLHPRAQRVRSQFKFACFFVFHLHSKKGNRMDKVKLPRNDGDQHFLAKGRLKHEQVFLYKPTEVLQRYVCYHKS